MRTVCQRSVRHRVGISAQTSSCAGFSGGTASIAILVIGVPCSRLTSFAADAFVRLDTASPTRLVPASAAACAPRKGDSAPPHSVTFAPSLLHAGMRRSWTLASLVAP